MTALPLDTRITVDRVTSDRMMVLIERRRSRSFSLSIDEAAYLVGLLQRELPAVTVRQDDGQAAQLPEAGAL
jgi:hypothetical protein